MVLQFRQWSISRYDAMTAGYRFRASPRYKHISYQLTEVSTIVVEI